jgi:hypothetical protein
MMEGLFLLLLQFNASADIASSIHGMLFGFRPIG